MSRGNPNEMFFFNLMALMESLDSDTFYESDLSSGKNLTFESGIKVNQSYM